MKTTKDVNSTVSEPRTVASPVIEPPSVPAITASTLPLSSEQYMYFTERDIDRILENLDGLRERVFPKLHGEDALDALHAQHFPSVCLIGLGRCGSNIALDVASLVYNARRFYLNEFSAQEKNGEQRPASWIRSNLRLSSGRGAKPVFLIEPLVMLVAPEGRHAACEYRVTGEYLATDDGLPEACGQRYEMRVGAFFEIHNGLISRISLHFNLPDWLAQVDD